MDNKAIYYGIAVSGSTVEHGSVDSGQALKVIDERFAAMKDKYESAEEAIAATMFGFSMTADTFIEICINARDNISFKFEFPAPPKLFFFRGVSQTTLELHSKEELASLVPMFFSAPSAAYKDYLKSYKGR